MPNPDPNPLPYGALHYYQAHYIIEAKNAVNDNLLCKCEPIVKGRFGNKQVVDVKWIGVDSFAETLQADTKLTEMLKEIMLQVGEVRIDPQDDHIRIYAKWSREDNFHFNETMFEIADRIAMHIKKKLTPIAK